MENLETMTDSKYSKKGEIFELRADSASDRRDKKRCRQKSNEKISYKYY